MSILPYQFDDVHERLLQDEPDFGKTICLIDEAKRDPSMLPLWPVEWLTAWEEAKKAGQVPYQIKQKFKITTQGSDFHSEKHSKMKLVAIDEASAANYPDPPRVRPWLPFDSGQAPGLEPCARDTAQCDPYFWVNYFFTWPLAARMERAFTDSFLSNQEKLLPGYVKGEHHNQKYKAGKFMWARSDTDYYPIGDNISDWNGGTADPFLDWVHFLNYHGDDSTSREKEDAMTYGVPEQTFENIAHIQPMVRQPGLVTYNWNDIATNNEGVLALVAEKFALYVFLHYLNESEIIITKQDYTILVYTFMEAMRGDDTREYARAGVRFRRVWEQREKQLQQTLGPDYTPTSHVGREDMAELAASVKDDSQYDDPGHGKLLPRGPGSNTSSNI